MSIGIRQSWWLSPRGRASATWSEQRLGYLSYSRQQVIDMLFGGLRLFVVVAQVTEVGQMLYGPPLRCVDGIRRFQCIVQIRNGWIFLRNLDGVILAHLREVPFESYPSQGT